MKGIEMSRREELQQKLERDRGLSYAELAELCRLELVDKIEERRTETIERRARGWDAFGVGSVEAMWKNLNRLESDVRAWRINCVTIEPSREYFLRQQESGLMNRISSVRELL